MNEISPIFLLYLLKSALDYSLDFFYQFVHLPKSEGFFPHLVLFRIQCQQLYLLLTIWINTINSEILARTLFSQNFASFVKINPREMA